MYVIEIIPISKGVPNSSLTYFTTKEIDPGCIVTVPLRKKMIHGIVIGIRNASEMKADIKNADFSLKKVDKIKSTRCFTPHFMEMVSELAAYYATAPGSVINTLVPKYILDNIDKIEKGDFKQDKVTHIGEKYVIQGDSDERFSTWKGLIRQEFARKKSILFIMPTIEDAISICEKFKKGIEGYIFLLHGSMTPKEIVKEWNRIMEEKHPVVVVATGGFLSLPRQDIETIIVENESDRAYKVLKRPYLDIRNACEILAQKRGVNIYFADNLLRIETLYRESIGELVQTPPFKFRFLSTVADRLIDMRSVKKFEVLSSELINLIRSNKANSEHMVILTTRKGVSPTTICRDCQNIVLCNNCSSPVVLHSMDNKKFFMCHRCGERRSAEEYCKTCGSWKLEAIGIGIDLVLNTIKESLPEIDVFKIDSDSTTSKSSAHNIIQKFRSKPGSVLVGTEMMLQYIHEKIENSAIVSLDSLFSMPDFRIQERIAGIIIKMRSISMKEIVIQTRKSDEKIFEYSLKGNLIDFYRNEIEERKKFNYPPFTTLIKLTLEGKKEVIVKEMEMVQDILDPYEVEVFPAFTHTIKGNYILHGLIRLQTKKWPDIDLLNKLNELPQSVTIKVDPETLL